MVNNFCRKNHRFHAQEIRITRDQSVYMDPTRWMLNGCSECDVESYVMLICSTSTFGPQTMKKAGFKLPKYGL